MNILSKFQLPSSSSLGLTPYLIAKFFPASYFCLFPSSMQGNSPFYVKDVTSKSAQLGLHGEVSAPVSSVFGNPQKSREKSVLSAGQRQRQGVGPVLGEEEPQLLQEEHGQQEEESLLKSSNLNFLSPPQIPESYPAAVSQELLFFADRDEQYSALRREPGL